MNINDYVSVELTAYGAEVYNEWASQLQRYSVAEKAEGDVLRDSLWHIMKVFGGVNIGLGMQSPFKECQLEIV